MMRQTFQLVAGQAYLAAKESLDENGDPLSDEAAWNVSTVTGLIGGAFEVLGLKMFSKAVAHSINRMHVAQWRERVRRQDEPRTPPSKAGYSRLSKDLGAGGLGEARKKLQSRQLRSSPHGGRR
jgi:hypothetical protein